MDYQQTVNFFRSVAEKVNQSGHFVHGRRVDVAIDYDMPFPQIALLPIRSEPNRQNANITHRIVLLFLDQDTPETSNEEREEIIQKMYVLLNTFMDELLENPLIQVTNEIITPEYRIMQATASGYSVSFTIPTKLPCYADKC